ncbi:MAG: Rieske (2Fe-2S) protein [Myxococcales bacterium]|nr:Rieske (2Fe-2S) protein [Myxococcales bacterium]
MTKRSLPVIEQSRREFVTAAAATLLAGCAAPMMELDAGDSGAPNDSATPADTGVDTGSTASDTGILTDATASDTGIPADAPSGGTCPSGVRVVGRPSDFTLNTPRLVTSGLFVVRDARGFYALTSICTHQGCDVAPAAGGFRCPCHGATYDLNGGNTGGPAMRPLEHYAMCTLANGQLGVDFSRVVAANERLVVA